MKKLFILFSLALISISVYPEDFSSDVFETSRGDLKITFLGHGTLMFEFDNKVIHIDPWSRVADYSQLPDADIILITHHHGDHLDMNAIKEVQKEGSIVVMTPTCREQLEDFSGELIMANGDVETISGIRIEAVPAYNIKHTRSNGQPYHPKGIGNAYLVSLGDKNVLIGGDTENVPEIKKLRDVDIAFLPMNLPYTMTPEMVADAAKAMKPEVLYPYHYGKTDPNLLVDLLKDEEDIEVRIRPLD